MDTQTAIILFGVGAFIYLMIYKKNRFFGGIGFMLLGGSLILTVDNTTMSLLGVTMILASIATILYDALNNN